MNTRRNVVVDAAGTVRVDIGQNRSVVLVSCTLRGSSCCEYICLMEYLGIFC